MQFIRFSEKKKSIFGQVRGIFLLHIPFRTKHFSFLSLFFICIFEINFTEHIISVSTRYKIPMHNNMLYSNERDVAKNNKIIQHAPFKHLRFV